MKQRFENLGITLSRDLQKKIGGGEGCSITWQDSAGHWHTEHGHCHVPPHGAVGGPNGYPGGAYCRTEHHQSPTPLSSNGGLSRCA